MDVLVAEDDPTLQQMVAIMLSRKSISCTLVKNGHSAVEAWESGNYRLIFMDVRMPEMDGLEATRIIREREKNTGRHVTIIAMTAHVMPGDREVCRAAGMDDYLAKPIDFKKFYSLVERYAATGE